MNGTDLGRFQAIQVTHLQRKLMINNVVFILWDITLIHNLITPVYNQGPMHVSEKPSFVLYIKIIE